MWVKTTCIVKKMKKLRAVIIRKIRAINPLLFINKTNVGIHFGAGLQF